MGIFRFLLNKLSEYSEIFKKIKNSIDNLK